jgi:hypothetical protein
MPWDGACVAALSSLNGWLPAPLELSLRASTNSELLCHSYVIFPAKPRCNFQVRWTTRLGPGASKKNGSEVSYQEFP